MNKISAKNKNNYIDFKINDAQKMIEKFRQYINKYNCPEITLDLSSLNIIDAAKVMVLSSTYHFKKYPDGKLKCHIESNEIKGLISSFAVRNIELV